MYLRVTKRRKVDGSEVRYYQLAENTWDAERGCAIARVIYNFGRADQLVEARLLRLAASILRVVSPAATTRADAAPGGELRIHDRPVASPADPELTGGSSDTADRGG